MDRIRRPLRLELLGTARLAALLLLAACGDGTGGDPPDQRTAVQRAVDFAGGPAAVGGLTGMKIEATGTRYMDGEGAAAGDPAAKVSTFTTAVSYDLQGGNLRVAYDRSIAFLGGLPLMYSEIYRGNLGYITGSDSVLPPPGAKAMLSARWASGRKQQLLLNPLALLRAAVADPKTAAAAGEGMDGGVKFALVDAADAIRPIRLWIAEDGRIARATTLLNDFLLRDAELEVRYEDWEAFAGVKFPRKVTIRLGGQLVHEEQRTAVVPNASFDAATFMIPAEAMPAPVYTAADARWGEETHQFFQQFTSLGISLDFRQDLVMAKMLAPGIYHLLGGSHNSLAIEQAQGVVIVEAPNYPERGEKILAWAKTQFPGKPVTHVIATHHHTDHTAGLRAFVAAGAKVVIGAASKSFFERVFSAKSTVVPDSLSAAPKAPVFETVPASGNVVLADPTRPVRVYALQNPHATDMLLIYLPAAGGGIAFESDLYNPGNGGMALSKPGAQALLDGIKTLAGGLEVKTLAGGHGLDAPLKELEDYLRRN